MEHLKFGEPGYGLTKNLGNVEFAAARERVEAALKEQGFGVLTEIDVAATMKKKIDVDLQPYVILGACKPKLAHQALTAEPGIGLLLAYNVVLTKEQSGDVIVSAINPESMFQVVNRDDVQPLAADVKARLEKVMAGISG